ncbi:MAG TPA: phosphatase PAP2 family protein, partial [Acidimicrobiales bacterium]|nr:phosphatase PAP2 family protein [Acidimicrobiales bacterium]
MASPVGLQRPLRWWRELLVTVGFYVTYAVARDAHGRATIPTEYSHALTNARHVISAEKQLHVGGEHTLQVAALHAGWLVRSANVFYGSAHFIVTAVVLVWLYRRQPDRYRRWRTILAIGTGVALVGFIVYPVLPPRMLPASYGFEDTLHSLGGLWSFNSGVIEHISDPFAAMPSLHLC